MTRFACTRWFTPFQLAVTALPFACAIDSRVFPAPDPASNDLSVPPLADGGLCGALDSSSACRPACAPCPVPAGGEVTCTMGQCSGRCPSDQQLCDGGCVPRGTCVSGCVSGAECIGGLACRDGTCPSTCTSDDDCIDDHFCADGQCIGRVIQLAGGSANAPTACSLHSDGLVRCWGDGEAGEFGEASGPGPVVVPLPMAAQQIAVGDRQVCAVMSDASLWCWGDVRVTSAFNVSPPAPYGGLANVASVALSGPLGGCVRHDNGTVSCWGRNSGGQLGRGTEDDGTFSPPGVVPGLTDVVEIARGGSHMCARLSTGAMSCWGSSSFGEVGNVTANSYASAPLTVSGMTDAKQIAAGNGASFALLGGATDGVLMAWGWNRARGTGDPGLASLVTPTRVGGTTLFRAVSAASGGFACGITTSGGVQCWGQHVLNAELIEDFSPVDIAGVADATALGVGGNFACALVGPIRVLCWGNNGSGQLGNDSPGSMTPTAVIW